MCVLFENKYPFLLTIYNLANINRALAAEQPGVIHVSEKPIEPPVLEEVPGFYPAVKEGDIERITTFFAVAESSIVPFKLRDGMEVKKGIKVVRSAPKFLVACRTMLPGGCQNFRHRITIYAMP